MRPLVFTGGTMNKDGKSYSLGYIIGYVLGKVIKPVYELLRRK
jgi:hypothetical protein